MCADTWNRIGAEQRASDAWALVCSPYDGSVVGRVAVGTASDMDDAIACAARAAAKMAQLPTHVRAAVLEDASRRILASGEELAILMARESGKPLRFARSEVERAAMTFRLGADEARRLGGEVLPVDLLAAGEGRLCLYRRVPRGPVAAISPFNFPLNLVAHKVSPAIAIGAPVVLKPPQQSPLTAFALHDILLRSGLPPEGLSVVHCPPHVGQRMVEDPRMAVLSFTGSDKVGWELQRLARGKRILLELGGNAPCVIDADVSFPAIMERLVFGAWAQAGQICIKAQRIFVHRERFDDFLDQFAAATQALALGDPLDPETFVGPLIEVSHAQRVMAWIAEAVSAGACVHLGNWAKGALVAPTILTGVPDHCRVVRDEVFGPVCVVEPFDDFREVVHRCNTSRFGLQAGVFTNNLTHALYAFEHLQFGGVVINDVPTFRTDNIPYGGVKDSGLGREGVRYAMEEMSEVRTLILRGRWG